MNAIILAAGKGTRLEPLTNDTPKSLIKINGKSLIEIQIEFLLDKNICDIIIVTGYLSEKFDYLKSKYNVNLIYNDKYDYCNNIYSMYLAREYFGDSYVIESDVYLNNNFIESNVRQSTYFSAYKENFKNEWILNFDKYNNIRTISIGDDKGYILSGVSFWDKKSANLINKRIDEVIKNYNYTDLYWDNIVKDNINNLDIKIRKLNSNDCFEIDSLDDLLKLLDVLKTNK